MTTFTSTLSPDSDAIAIFVSEKLQYKDKKGILHGGIGHKLTEAEKKK